MEDLSIIERLRVLQKELEQLRYSKDPYIISRFVYHWVKCKDVLKPLEDIQSQVHSIDSLCKVIGFLNEPHKGYGPTYPSDRESAYQGPYRRATQTLEEVIRDLDLLLNSKKPAPITWPLAVTMEQMEKTNGYIFCKKQNV